MADPTDGSTDGILALMQQVAAEYINPRFRQLSDGQVFEKGPGDLVTVADRESELALTQALQAIAADALIVGEEATAADPTLLDQLAQADHAYLVDPLDGTKNFVRGSIDHAVIVAELRGGDAVRGWIWQPQYEQGWTAVRGEGVRRNGQPLAPAPVHPRRQLATSSSKLPIPQGYLRVDARGCCGVDYPELLAGSFDVLGYGNPKPWDHAAGVLMARELGGEALHLDGQQYLPGRKAARGNPLVVAVTARLLQPLVRN